MTERVHNTGLLQEMSSIVVATNAIPNAEKRAEGFEKKAATIRKTAENDRLKAFTRASSRLIELVDGGEISILETVVALAEMRDQDPELLKLYDGKKADEIISSFELLTEGTPVVNLPIHQSFDMGAGIVVQPPFNVDIHVPQQPKTTEFIQPFMAPWATLDIGMLTRDGGEKRIITAKFELESIRDATIGRAAIQSLFNESKLTYTNTSCNYLLPNINDLHSLKLSAENLAKLGQEPFDTTNLDDEIEKYQDNKVRIPSQARHRQPTHRHAHLIE